MMAPKIKQTYAKKETMNRNIPDNFFRLSVISAIAKINSPMPMNEIISFTSAGVKLFTPGFSGFDIDSNYNILL